MIARGAGADAGLGPPVRPACRRRAPDRAPFAASCGQLAVGWHFCARSDPPAKGCVERLQASCDCSLDPRLVGRRVEARIGDREVLAIALDTGELACQHARSFARHRTIIALEHAGALKTRCHERRSRSAPVVEVRSLAVYDQLIA